MSPSPRLALLPAALALVALLWLGLVALPPSAEALAPPPLQWRIDHAPAGGTVVIEAGTFTESLYITQSITLIGAGSGSTIIKAPIDQRAIAVTFNNNLSLVNLSVIGGNPTDNPGGSPTGFGGGIYIDGGRLLVSGCLIAGNAGLYGGGIFQNGISSAVEITASVIQSNSSVLHGGGIYTKGPLVVSASDFLSNTAGQHGGGIHGAGPSSDVTGGLFANNRAQNGNGGAVNVDNALSITGTRFITNSATIQGGAVNQWNAGYPVALTDAWFERNGVGLQGGGLWAHGNVTITGGAFLSNTAYQPGPTSVAGAGAYLGGSSAYVSGATFRGNEARCSGCSFMDGGGINLSSSTAGQIRLSTFEGNVAWFGAGVNGASASSTLLVQDSVFARNDGGYGAGIMTYNADIRGSQFLTNTGVNWGAAVVASNRLDISASRFVANSAGVAATVWSSGPMTVVNTVFLANSAGSGAAVLHLDNTITRTMSQVTIAFPTKWSGAAINVQGGGLVITNSIIASYTTGITVPFGSAVVANGVLWHNNTINHGGPGSFSADQEITGTPAFASDGYHLTAVSPAIDHGVNSGVATDIDGNPRPFGAGYDLGAVEYPRYRAYLPLTVRNQ